MSINSVGTNAYSFVQQALNNTGTSGTSSASETDGFASLIGDAIKSTTNTVRNSENISANAILGKASLADVVTAVNSADVALKSVVAIRDRVIGAYQDIMKMPI